MSEKYGFVYIWFDRKRKMYYIGSHWGYENDGYICSSNWMRTTYKRRPEDFRRRVIKRIYSSRKNLLDEEERWLNMIKREEIKHRYYNLNLGGTGHWSENLLSYKRISERMKGNKHGSVPCSPEKAAKISAAKKASFQKRREQYGYVVPPEIAIKMGEHNIGRKHTDEWKKDNSIRMKKQWKNGERTISPNFSWKNRKNKNHISINTL